MVIAKEVLADLQTNIFKRQVQCAASITIWNGKHDDMEATVKPLAESNGNLTSKF